MLSVILTLIQRELARNGRQPATCAILLDIAEDPAAFQGRGTGWALWDGAVVAAKYLDLACRQLEGQQQELPTVCPTPTPTTSSTAPLGGRLYSPTWLRSVTDCIELGSGTGFCGLAAAAALQVWIWNCPSLEQSTSFVGNDLFMSVL
jgi:hypothetical protein